MQYVHQKRISKRHFFKYWNNRKLSLSLKCYPNEISGHFNNSHSQQGDSYFTHMHAQYLCISPTSSSHPQTNQIQIVLPYDRPMTALARHTICIIPRNHLYHYPEHLPTPTLSEGSNKNQFTLVKPARKNLNWLYFLLNWLGLTICHKVK